MGNSQYERDFNDQSALKRPGRLDFRTLNNVDDAGDGHPGVQKAMRNYIHEGGMEKDIDLVTHGIIGTSVLLTNAKLQQLSNISTTTISSAQWVFVGEADQAVKQADTVTFATVTVNAGGVIVGSIQLTDAEWTQLANIGASVISSNEWAQIANIGDATTITAGDWTNLASIQNVSTSSSPTFVGLTLSANLVTTSTIDGVDVSSHTHSGAGTNGVKVPFTSLSGDIVYTQLDSLVDGSGGGSASMISGAQHQHTDADGSTKIAHANTTGISVPRGVKGAIR